jgi:drug/metabolite transporter (DMT)-like permease
VTKTVICTALALVAFALNSILCRLALRGGEADAAGFTAMRLAAGAFALLLLGLAVRRAATRPGSGRVSAFLTDRGSWTAALFLFAYAILFSLAYLNLTAATGALILFGSVQMTMVAASLIRGERPGRVEWLGLMAALGGLVYLVYPGLESPPLASAILMVGAGASWGLYSLRGKGSRDAIADTSGNFIRSLPFAAAALLVFLPALQLSAYGLLLAVISGALTSGIGYAIWYTALKDLTTTRAAVLQLAVPVLTAIIGVLFLGEAAGIRLAIAGALILGGIGLVIIGRASSPKIV